jgi:hypothetical protein
MRFEVLTAVKMSMLVFWDVTLCGLVADALKMEAICSFETLVSTYKSARHCNSEVQRRQLVQRYSDLNQMGAIFLCICEMFIIIKIKPLNLPLFLSTTP